jgi:hypothetical protein
MGVRTLSHYESTLLSAGFECDARTWDLVTKDPVAILRGHRFPVAAAKLMCDRAQSEKEHRAVRAQFVPYASYSVYKFLCSAFIKMPHYHFFNCTSMVVLLTSFFPLVPLYFFPVADYGR